MKRFIVACLLTASLSLSADADQKSPAVEISAKVLAGDSIGDLTLGLTYDLDYKHSNLGNISMGEAESLLHVRLNGTLALNANLNKEALVSQVMAGFSLLGGKARKNEFSIGMDPNQDRGKAKDVGNWGYIYAGLNLRHETIQTFDEQNLAAGLELGYINPRDEDVYAFIPSVILAYEYVDGIVSDIEEDQYSRLRIEAALKSDFGKQVFNGNALEPLGLRLDGRYYQAHDMDRELEDEGRDDITYFAVALTYKNKAEIAGFERQTFFIQLSNGRIPPNTEDDTIVSAGVIVPIF